MAENFFDHQVLRLTVHYICTRGLAQLLLVICISFNYIFFLAGVGGGVKVKSCDVGQLFQLY